jgi:hypothetical protein
MFEMTEKVLVMNMMAVKVCARQELEEVRA